MNEIFGNLCQVAAAKNLSNQEVFNRMDSYQLFLIRSNQWGELNFKTLKQFDDDYFTILKQGRNYGWYQTQFYLKAKELYSIYGDVFLDKFRTFLINITPNQVGNLDDEELDQLLIDAFGNEIVEILKWEHDS